MDWAVDCNSCDEEETMSTTSLTRFAMAMVSTFFCVISTAFLTTL
jgi:hypothetical protein